MIAVKQRYRKGGRFVSGTALAAGAFQSWRRQPPVASGSLIESFNGKPQALPLDFAYDCGSPLNENDQCTTQSAPR